MPPSLVLPSLTLTESFSRGFSAFFWGEPLSSWSFQGDARYLAKSFKSLPALCVSDVPGVDGGSADSLGVFFANLRNRQFRGNTA